MNISNSNPHKYEAINLMQEKNLISYRTADFKRSLIDITPKGRDVLKAGGIEKYLIGLYEKDDKEDQIRELTLQKLKFEQIPAKFWYNIIIAQIIIAAAVTFLLDRLKE